jgi:hypothetical protein
MCVHKFISIKIHLGTFCYIRNLFLVGVLGFSCSGIWKGGGEFALPSHFAVAPKLILCTKQSLILAITHINSAIKWGISSEYVGCLTGYLAHIYNIIPRNL